MSFGWHPREHRKALDGMLMLTLEERGAYNTCLDLIYDREGPIPDDSRWLAGWMGASSKKWAKIRASLIFKGKLFEVCINGQPSLMNQRAAIELENQAKLSRKLRENGAKGGRKVAETRANANENNGDPEALGSAPLKLMTETRTEEEVSVAKATGGDPPDNPDRQAWIEGPVLLVAENGMSLPAAKVFFGGLLKKHGLEPRDLLGAIGECKSSGTRDPKSYLAGAAQLKARKRQPTGPPKRVGFV